MAESRNPHGHEAREDVQELVGASRCEKCQICPGPGLGLAQPRRGVRGFVGARVALTRLTRARRATACQWLKRGQRPVHGTALFEDEGIWENYFLW